MNRRETSGGQAIVLVTLALMAMCGMMGLAVDMGWSFFVHKQAQTAADAAALGAVQEAITRISGNGVAVTAFTCAGNGGTGATQADCRTAAVGCATVVGTGSNLDNGCQYAKKNGFDWTTARQAVTVQSNDGEVANRPTTTAPGVVNLTYWVTVRTVQTIPQLFSAVMSRTEGTVSAVATAAIAAAIGPGQFYGMNRQGDCTGTTGTALGVLTIGTNCGVDYLGAQGNGKQTDCGTSKANLCAPAGIILASNCTTAVANHCTSDGAGNGDAMGNSLTIMGDGKGKGGTANGAWRDMGGNTLLPCPSGKCFYKTDASTFSDPTAPNPQPPLVSELTPDINGVYPAISACGLPNGQVPNNAVLGPLQYYSYDPSSPTKAPNGLPLTLQGNVSFSKDSTITGCPGAIANKVFTAGASQSASAFPTYIFYGGMDAGANNVTLRAGQYVMAGTSGTAVFDEKGGLTAPDNSTGLNTGTMMITTDSKYPGLADQWALLTAAGINTSAIANLKQGQIAMKNGDIEMKGLINSNVSGSTLPEALNAYSGIAVWQDRRNSAVAYNAAPGSPGCPDCTGDDGTVLYCANGGDCAFPDSAKLATRLAANNVTATSPGGINADSGNANMALQGVFYQPRGAWMDLSNGNVGFTCPVSFGGNPNTQCPLQIVTGALLLGNGTTAVTLAGPTNPIITYKPVLIH